jgi:hypothetical protein
MSIVDALKRVLALVASDGATGLGVLDLEIVFVSLVVLVPPISLVLSRVLSLEEVLLGLLVYFLHLDLFLSRILLSSLHF